MAFLKSAWVPCLDSQQFRRGLNKPVQHRRCAILESGRKQTCWCAYQDILKTARLQKLIWNWQRPVPSSNEHARCLALAVTNPPWMKFKCWHSGSWTHIPVGILSTRPFMIFFSESTKRTKKKTRESSKLMIHTNQRQTVGGQACKKNRQQLGKPSATWICEFCRTLRGGPRMWTFTLATLLPS